MIISTQMIIDAFPFIIITVAGICITYGGIWGILKAFVVV